MSIHSQRLINDGRHRRDRDRWISSHALYHSTLSSHSFALMAHCHPSDIIPQCYIEHKYERTTIPPGQSSLRRSLVIVGFPYSKDLEFFS
jgi:hypothetical protein